MNYLKSILVTVLFCFNYLSLSHAEIRSGGISSNGGDGIVSEVFDIATSLHRLFEKNNIKVIDLNLFYKKLLSVKIYSEPRVYLNGKEVGAINTPVLNTITFSQQHWFSLQNSPKLKLVLVLHEFLGLMGYSDADFSISNKILDGPGVMTAKVTCPLLFNSSIKNSEAYSLEVVQYKIENYHEYRTFIYHQGLPSNNSKTLSADRFKFVENNIVLSLLGTALISVGEMDLIGGLLVNFEVWKNQNNQFIGEARLTQLDQSLKFVCEGTLY